ncbi:hypothetical protein FNO01nite_28070 [Flavobacterium noncentrifugens]|uniref:Fibronectin type-III domain-containing protein n=1 Tax=Flavobacterium noncentrifugens TaxID=1128970 RepID=A0A1G9CS51_9FLAO|nr:GEVED domain-containing protein [Flavobacterium noncentrifugens]GEP52135.1 hypothetical protein FNO01nite_28070 [Flavobacterium noncentrifugens]SDK54513.1 hypothetical protein SAMN04487935_3634 [Flavobacterium noncentrifugens]
MIKQLLSLFCGPAEKSNAFVFFKKSFLIIVLLAAWNSQGQVSSYTPTGVSTTGTTTTSYATIQGGPGTTGVFGTTAWNDDVVANVPLGFTFVFNGRSYTACNISSNGFITFGSAPSTTNYTPLSSTETYDGAVAVFAQDLRTANLDIFKQTAGVAGARTFIVQYNANRLSASNTVITATIAMQIVLNETSNSIELRYGAGSGSSITGATGQVGVRGENNTDFNNKNFTGTAWPTASPIFTRGTANNQTVAVRVSTTGMPAKVTLTYTPPSCFAPVGVNVAVASVTQNSAVVSWTAPTPAPVSGYQYLVSTTGPSNINIVYPLSGTAATGSVGAGVTTTPLTLASPDTQYYVYVRSNCGATSGWSVAATFRTLCTPQIVNPAYSLDFSSLPTCTRIETTNPIDQSFGFWALKPPSTPNDWGFSSSHLRITAKPASATTGANRSGFYTQGLTLDGSKSYRVSYKYGASAEQPTTNQRLKLTIGTAPVASAVTDTLARHVDFRGGPLTNVVNFYPPSGSGTYYFGFIDYSKQLNATTLLDDIVIEESTCKDPTGLISGLVTPNSASIGWTAPTTPPGSGYFYYISPGPSFVAPVFTTAATGSASGLIGNLSGLTPGTTYRFWVRSNCGNGDMSGWSLTYGTFTTPTAPTLPPASCTPVLGTASTYIKSFSTTGALANISNTSGANPGGYGNYTALSVTQTEGQSINFTVTSSSTTSGDNVGISIWVDWNHDGTFATGERVFNTTGYVVSASGTFAVPLGATSGAGRMRVLIDYNSTNPNNPCAYNSGKGETEDYTFYVLPLPPPVVLSAASVTICRNETSTVPVTITTGTATYDTFFWTPNVGVIGNAITGYTFNPTSNVTYTFNAFNSTTFQTATTKFNVIVNQPPTSIVITPASATTCQQGPAQLLSTTGGLISGVKIYGEDFNSDAPGWLVANSTGGPDGALSAWGLAPDGYYFYGTYHSNDYTQFAFAESDSAGFYNTNTSLTSPEINLTGYSTISLSFWQYYRYYSVDTFPESGTVQIATNDDAYTTWAPLATYTATSQGGTATNFINSIIDLSLYQNKTIKLRFVYAAYFDYGWGIDNIVISGSGSSAVSWTPNGVGSGLFTDAGATNVYNGGPAASVYALPQTNATYRAAAASGLGCQTYTDVAITVTPFDMGTIAPAVQTACSGVASDITITGATTGTTIVRWEWANNAAFTSPTTIANTTMTLTSAQIKAACGIMTGDRYFRAIQSGCIQKASQIVKVTVPTTTFTGTWSSPPDATKMAIFVTGTTLNADFNACAVVIQGGAIIVNSGVTLNVEHGVHITGGSLSFNNNASLLQADATVVNTNPIAYKRNSQTMHPFDYTYWSSPVGGQTLFNLSPNTRFDKYMAWDPVAYAWSVIAAPSSTIMTPGKGYIARAGTDIPVGGGVYTAPFLGIPNNGTITTLPNSVYVNPADPAKNVNLLGNPYPSALDAEKLMKDPSNAASLGGGTTLYFWTHNTNISNQAYNSSDYATYNYTGGTGITTVTGVPGANASIPTKYIAAGQGFMASIVGTGYTDVVFKNTMRAGGLNNQNFYKNENTESEVEKNRLWLEFKNDQSFKQILLGYIEGATNNYERGYDGESLESGNTVGFYTINGAKKFTTQGRALPFVNSDVVPLGYRTTTAGTYEISLALKDGLFESGEQKVYLEDRLLLTTHDFTSGSYSFATEAGTFDNRFLLKYTNTALATTDAVFDENAIVVYKDQNGINLKTKGITMSVVKIYDIKGSELLFRNNINSTTAVISNLAAAQQVLLVKVTSVDGITVVKKIIF